MRRIIDLTLTLAPEMRGVELHPANALDVDGWNAKRLELYSHCGTHMDAPRHFLPDGNTIDSVDLSACIGPARVVDLTPIEPRELITVEHLGTAADAIGKGDRLLLRTDWHKRHGTAEYRDALPRVDIELARWLVDRGVALLGVEPPSVADVNDREELTSVHRILLGGGVVIVEGLAHLDQIDSETVDLTVLPLKVLDGDGAPVRAVAIRT
ncbi:MAG TPA: cyclase family protein [Thermoguttaceae bacterium]|nr:cyclase family protein [Thermoguttaceae bacterium]